MFKKIILVFISAIVFTTWSVQAYTQAELVLFYDKLYTQVAIKSQYNEQKILWVLDKIEQKLEAAVLQTSSFKNKKILGTLITFNKEKKVAINNKPKTIEVESWPETHPQYINNLLKNGYTYFDISSQSEFVENGQLYKFSFKKYYELNLNNHAYFIKNHLPNSVIVFFQWKYIVTNDFSKERKYTYQDLESMFTHFIDVKNPYVLQDGVYYSYKYNYYIFFDNINSFSESDFQANKIDLKTTLFIKNGENYFFSNDYQNIRLTSENIISWITNKKEFLYSLADDNKFFVWNYDDVLAKIKSDTFNLVSWINNNQQKIRKIYDFVVDQTSYYENYTVDGNKQVFSWILTYKNKTWVCDGYTKLFLYMLSFAWISDVEIKRWFAYDNTDFPNFGHAWVRIGNDYYDPTFDDPIGWSRNGNYYYFGIPQDLMYVNRFDGIIIPETLKQMSLQERKNLVMKNMYGLYNDYRNFALMNTIKNRKYLWLDYNQTITLPLFLEKTKIEEVRSGEFSHEWYRFLIKSLSYYVLTENNIESIVSSPKIDLEDMYLLKWYKNDGTFDYRLAYDIIFD